VTLDVGGSAKFNTDYTSNLTLNGSVVARAFGGDGISASSQAYIDIPAGQSSVVLRINPIDDPIVEGTEDASFTLLANPAYRLGKNRTAGVSIGDDDLLIFRPFNVTLTRRHILDSIFSDNAASWELSPDGSWQRRRPADGERAHDHQLNLTRRARLRTKRRLREARERAGS